MGESVSEGIVSRWLKAVGDSVVEGEPLVEVTTDKVDVEVPAPAAGQLSKIVVAEGETVAVGAVLGLITPGVASVANAPAPPPEPVATAVESVAPTESPAAPPEPPAVTAETSPPPHPAPLEASPEPAPVEASAPAPPSRATAEDGAGL